MFIGSLLGNPPVIIWLPSQKVHKEGFNAVFDAGLN